MIPLDRVDSHVTKLQPHISMDREFVSVLILKFLAELLAMCQRSHELRSMTIVLKCVHPTYDLGKATLLLGLVLCDLNLAQLWRASADIQC